MHNNNFKLSSGMSVWALSVLSYVCPFFSSVRPRLLYYLHLNARVKWISYDVIIFGGGGEDDGDATEILCQDVER